MLILLQVSGKHVQYTVNYHTFRWWRCVESVSVKSKACIYHREKPLFVVGHPKFVFRFLSMRLHIQTQQIQRWMYMMTFAVNLDFDRPSSKFGYRQQKMATFDKPFFPTKIMVFDKKHVCKSMHIQILLDAHQLCAGDNAWCPWCI